MATWAAKLASVTEDPQSKLTATPDDEQTVAILDANAIISLGEQARTLGDILVTTEEVVAEIKDAASRTCLERLCLVRRAPTDDAVRAVACFATKTGDFHQLSSEDVRLLALAYTYEAERYGVSHLRKLPVSVRAHTRRPAAAKMPGWGTTSNNEEWDAIDKVQDTGIMDADDSVSATPSRAAASSASIKTRPTHEHETDDTWEVAKRSKNAARRAKRKAEARARIPAAIHETRIKDHAGLSEPSAGLDEASLSSDDVSDSDHSGLHDQVEECGDPEDVLESSDSKVHLVTSDFPMQNVAIQMGLRLQSRGGRRITNIQRSVLRCDACSQVVKSQNKMFCPACGHATLSRVSVSIGPDGAEHYGVRNRHTLKGTRFSLPKPRGGKGAPIPILSEDVYNSKVRRPRTKPKPSADPLEDLTLGEYKKHAPHSRGVAKGLSYLVTGPSKNPNERKNMPRSNRRR